MSVTDRTAPSQSEALAFEVELRHALAKVWRAVTDAALLSEWLLPVTGLRLEPGAEFTFNAPPKPGWDGIVRCRMREVAPPTRVSWHWVVGDLDTVLTLTLVPTESGTRLLIVQSGFTPSQKHNLGGARYGWKMMGERLVELLTRIP